MSYRTLATALLLCACSAPRYEAANHPHSTRIVVPPSAIAALSSDHETLGLPGEVCFGSVFGRSALYLRFPDDWRGHGVPLQATIALAAREGAAIDGGPVTLEAWRVNAAWQADALHAWSDKPALAPPHAELTFRPAPARDVRIDVTELLRFAAENPERDFGIALLSSGGPGHGASFATGMSGGTAPRLELQFAEKQ